MDMRNRSSGGFWIPYIDTSKTQYIYIYILDTSWKVLAEQKLWQTHPATPQLNTRPLDS